MRWFKLAAIAGGILIAFLLVGSVIGIVIHAVTDLVIAALVVGVIAVAIKVARSGRQISGKKAEREVRERDSHQPLPRAEVDHFTASVPAQPAQPPQPARRSAPSSADIDDELARLKREMGS
jgi:hypothetical protein